MLTAGSVPAGLIYSGTRALVVAFQTWLDLGDAQVLVGMTDGRVLSIDHGECFGSLTDPAAPPALRIADIPGVGLDVGREESHAAVIKPPADFSNANARRAYQHVSGWMKDEEVQVVDLDHAAEAFVG